MIKINIAFLSRKGRILGGNTVNTQRSKFNNSVVYYCTKTNTVLAHRPNTGALTKNIVKFDSKWEFKVYCELIKLVGANEVRLQPKVILKKESGLFGSLTYVCDFLAVGRFYIEAKGFLTPEALCKLKILEVLRLDIASNLLIVSENPVYLFGKKQKPSMTLEQMIETIVKSETQ